MRGRGLFSRMNSSAKSFEGKGEKSWLAVSIAAQSEKKCKHHRACALAVYFLDGTKIRVVYNESIV